MIFKNKKGNVWIALSIIVVAAMFMVVGLAYINGGKAPSLDSTSDGEVKEEGFPVVIESISGYNTSLIELTSSGSGVDKTYKLSIDKDNLANNVKEEEFTLTLKQDIPGQTTLSTDSVMTHDLKLSPSSNIDLENTTGSDVTVYDYSASTIGGQDRLITEKFSTTDPVQVNVTWVFNPDGKDLADIKSFNEVGEDYQKSINFGEDVKNEVTLEINN